MARRVEDVRPYWEREVEEAEWQPTPEQLARLNAAEASLDRGEGIPWEDFEPVLDGWIAEAGEDGEGA